MRDNSARWAGHACDTVFDDRGAEAGAVAVSFCNMNHLPFLHPDPWIRQLSQPISWRRRGGGHPWGSAPGWT